jgi:DNA-binding CsgD family transcriptional regulator
MPLDASKLSERELEILRLVATGASNKAIAQQLLISTNTVKVHLRNIFEKIQVETRTEAAMLAVSAGLVPGYSAPVVADDENGDKDQELPDVTWEETAQLTGDQASSGSRWKWIALAFGGALVLVIIALVFWQVRAPSRNVPQVQADLAWRHLAPMPTARYGFAVVAYQDAIYTIGGSGDRGITGDLEVYRPETDTWQVGSAMPTPATDIQAGVIGGKIYIPGGQVASGKISNHLAIYDPIEDRWEEGAGLPTATRGYSLAEFEGKLYVFGGENESGVLDTVQVYDPDQDTWTEADPLPTPLMNAGVTSVDSKILLLGGTDGKQILDSMLAYTPGMDNGQEDPWSKMGALPAARQKMGSASTLDVIYVVGGIGDENQSMPTQGYLVTTDSWQTLLNDPIQPWTQMGIVTLSNYLYAIGGLVDGQIRDDTLAIQVVYITVLPFVR